MDTASMISAARRGSSDVRKFALVNFTGHRANWGCQATSWEFLKVINEILGMHRDRQVALVPLLPRMSADRDIEQKLLDKIYESMELVSKAHLKGETPPATAISFLEKVAIERYGHYAHDVRSSDIVFFQAEGTMAGTDFVRGARLLLLPFVAKHAWRKKVYSMNQTILFCDDNFADVCTLAMSTFDFVSVRENISFDAAQLAGITNPYFIPDTAFLTIPGSSQSDASISTSTHFAVSGTAWFQEDVYDIIVETVENISRETNLTPLFCASTRADQKLIDLAKKRIRKFDVLPINYSYASASYYLKHCAFLIGGRYHLSILASSAGTPIVQLRGNSYKNEGLSAMLGGIAPVRDWSETDLIRKDVGHILQDRSRESRLLLTAVQSVREALTESIQWLSHHFRCEEFPVPASMLSPPGERISSKLHLPPYRRNSLAHAAKFSYPESSMPLGAPLRSAQLAKMLPMHNTLNPETRYLIRQLEASYP